MSTTTSASPSFSERVRATLADLPSDGVIDRFAANDVLLDLLDAAGPEEEPRVLAALGCDELAEGFREWRRRLVR